MPRDYEDESLIIYLKKELEAALVRNDSVEKENHELRQEVTRLKAQISSLRAHDNERKSMLWKKLNSSKNDLIRSDHRTHQQKPPDLLKVPEEPAKKGAAAAATKVEKPAVLAAATKLSSTIPSPPPPPPPTSAMSAGGLKALRRVPEVAEFYRTLTRKDTVRVENRAATGAGDPLAANPNMIGEIENRSAYLSAIKSDVEKRKEHINILIKEVESVAFKDISDVEQFVKWLDDELSMLVDERAVLKHFARWPEPKVDALREAAANFRDLRNLHGEAASFRDNSKEPVTEAVAKMQTMQDRLEQRVNTLERTREVIVKRCKDFQIPWGWLLDTGLLGQVKTSSLRVAVEYMKRVTKELQLKDLSGKDDKYLLQAARFAYRAHQFAGGFDAAAIEAFQGLKRFVIAEAHPH